MRMASSSFLMLKLKTLFKRSYQYVALYNVNNKFALSQGGWNTLLFLVL